VSGSVGKCPAAKAAHNPGPPPRAASEERELLCFELRVTDVAAATHESG
jgi:hypothetical protein